MKTQVRRLKTLERKVPEQRNIELCYQEGNGPITDRHGTECTPNGDAIVIKVVGAELSTLPNTESENGN